MNPTVALIGAFVVLISAPGIVVASASIRTSAMTGTPLSGAGDDVAVDRIFAGVLNNSGQTFATGTVSGAGVTPEGHRASWIETTQSQLRLVARQNDPVPGVSSDWAFQSLTSLNMNEQGQALSLGLLTNRSGGPNNLIDGRGVWIYDSAKGLHTIASSYTQAAGLSRGVQYEFFYIPPVFNDDGQVAFDSQLTGPGATDVSGGMWLYDQDAGLRLIARDGIEIPGPYGVFMIDAAAPVSINNDGLVAVTARDGSTGAILIYESNATQSEDSPAELTDRPGVGLRFAVYTGQGVPGIQGGAFETLRSPRLNDAGQMAFGATLRLNSFVTRDNDGGIWVYSEGEEIDLILREGDQAPGAANGVTFSSWYGPVLNGAGHVAVHATVTDGDGDRGQGIWAQREDGDLALVAFIGEAAPGTEEGVYFDSFAGSPPAFNVYNQLAFTANLAGDSTHDANDKGLWATTRSGVLRLIAREGEDLDVDDGPGVDFRTIRTLSFVSGGGNQDGLPSALNERGQIAFAAEFTDGTSGLFVSDRVAIPEPPSLWLSAVAFLATRRQSSGRRP